MKSKKEKSELNEQTIYECKTHWIAMVIPSIITVFFLAVFFNILLDGGGVKSFEILIIAILIFGIPFLKIKTNKLVLTDKRIYGKTGIIKTQSLTSTVQKIQTVNIDKKLFGRILGYADITIHCITGVYIFKNQSNAEEMQNAILNTIK